jgi:excisionase family DNA binding protein
MTKKAVFTTFEAAKLCHVSPLSIINWVNAGRLAAFRTPGGHRRIRRDDLVLFMRDNGLPLPDELQHGSGRRRVLIVEVESSIRDALSRQLSQKAKPYEVATAATPFEAGRQLATFRPDVVILDVRMQGLDGAQVCRSIKADPQTAGTLIVATTTHLSPEIEARLIECGASRCYSKPFDPGALSSFVESALDEQSRPKPRRGRTIRA